MRGSKSQVKAKPKCWRPLSAEDPADIAAVDKALAESHERIPYRRVRQELGLATRLGKFRKQGG